MISRAKGFPNARLVLAFVLLTPSFAMHSQVVKTSTGTVEFLGLQQRTVSDIKKLLGLTSNDELHYCAAQLEDIGFPDASSFLYSDNEPYVVVSVVEPEQADRVKYRPAPLGHVTIPLEWRNLVVEAEENYGADLAGGLVSYGLALQRNSEDVLNIDESRPWWRILRECGKETDYITARRVLLEDSSRSKRIVAAGILMNFAEKEEAWHTLMIGVRDPEDWVMVACFSALKSLSKHAQRPVRWDQVAEDIHHILNGTALFSLPSIIETLLNTGADETLAALFLKKQGGRMLLAYLDARHDKEKELAHSLLVRLRGKDLGYDSHQWEAWIESLQL